jgi:glutamine synthetase
MLGTWQHCSFYYDQIDVSSFTEGVPFDGSSIRGWKEINESDMAMVPDPAKAWIDPFMEEPTLIMICSIKEPRTGADYNRCPCNIAKTALSFLSDSDIGDTAYFGPEAEFFMFDRVVYEQTINSGIYEVESTGGSWNTGRSETGGNLGHKIRGK